MDGGGKMEFWNRVAVASIRLQQVGDRSAVAPALVRAFIISGSSQEKNPGNPVREIPGAVWIMRLTYADAAAGSIQNPNRREPEFNPRAAFCGSGAGAWIV